MLLTFPVLLVLGLVRPLYAVKRDQTFPGKQRSKLTSVALILDPKQMDTFHNSGLSSYNRSLTPWTYRETYEEDRLPQRLSQAECMWSYCESALGGEEAGLESKPIYYQTLVLRRVLSNRSKGGKRRKKSRKVGKKEKKTKEKYVYRLESEIVTVGCTCVLPSFSLQNQHSSPLFTNL